MRQGEYWEAMLAWIEDRTAERRHVAEVARAVGLRLFNIQLAKGKGLSPHDFMPLPWDEEEVPDDGGLSVMTPEEKQASLDRLKNIIDW